MISMHYMQLFLFKIVLLKKLITMKLLLIFFLVTTTIDTDKGLGIVLPPAGDVEIEIRKENILNCLINSKGKVLLDEEPTPVEQINKIARSYDLKVIEDACHAIQGEYNKKRCGSLGDIGCFSFHPLKNLNVWGDGGIITTNDESLASK